MNDRNVGIVDLDTGELIKKLGDSKKTGFQMFYGWKYCIMAQNGMIKLATDKDLSGQPLRVFLFMAGQLDFENFIRIQQKEVAEALEMQKADVSRALKLLESKNIFQRGPKSGQSYTWRMNPNFGFKGDPRGKVIKERDGTLRLIQNEG